MNNITGNKRRYLPDIGDGRDGGGWHGGGNFHTNPDYRHQPRSHYQVRQQQSQYVQRQHPTQQQYNQKQQWLRRNPNVSGSSTANTVDSSSQDWKAQLNIPAADSRFKTKDAKGNEFEDYFLKREILMGIYDKGFVSPSPIQEEIIPIALSGSDILAKAKTGAGKTAAFCIPALEKINTDKKVIQVVILVPTSELALETSQVCKELGQHLKVQVMVTSGGTSLEDDCGRLCLPVHLLIGTPGRILDLTKEGFCDLDDCAMLVLDEADKLLCPEFQPSVEHLISFLPESRQILMFSATFADTVEDFRKRYLKNPYLVNPMDELTLIFQAAEVGWLEKESLTLHNKVRFIEGFAPRSRTDAEMSAEMAKQKLTPMPKVAIVADVANASKTTIIPGTEFDYLLSMPIRNWLVREDRQRLREKRDEVTSLLLTETDALEKQLREQETGDEHQEKADSMET